VQATTPTVATAYSLRTYRRSGATSFATRPPSRCWLLLAALLGLNKSLGALSYATKCLAAGLPNVLPFHSSLAPAWALVGCVHPAAICYLLISSKPSEGGVHEYHFPAQPFSCHQPKTKIGEWRAYLLSHSRSHSLVVHNCVHILTYIFVEGTERPIFVRSE
jgi:hypothetical protein